ncbi:hypothetical protein COV88_03670 [Candidatus Saccharibacteria bacterium CG11_big_fil_rev_8_21_14_0_20_41_19]|nr:hypothetical protein [Candidatus Saccharibacteria bacterium]OIP85951.1 MAG: hypothetical protein AUK57_02160 [Candidatus Saccharibacteria bacterium CG2_30_41_52]PIQ70600.1 MAG: hypothetical protein COV88_03670 [Candidatus Saccharibacteria bacterium CG11_big_fil_rev_8_21_14_0_20_41_19]PIZ59640.1 MAG: hypothetical protein COY18_02950 [Candidatus Saccharibacteria bacterium CG_4_10_14_0_2_um_filter_41_11]PJC29778.1 MAG: hypothetical protein CO052_01600 [Candidatus Saccharibacteria bacterium CG_4
MKYFFGLLKLVLIVSIIAFAVTFYYKDKLVSISSDVHPATLKDPVQTPLKSSYKITFPYNQYSYVVNPLYDYKITGVVVSKFDYDPAENDAEKVIRYDLCMAWGKNVSDSVYLSPNISFSQNQRFCNYKYSQDIGFNANQMSNNHLVTTNESILEKLKTISNGDEISITGQLINMTASGTGNDNSGLKSLTWNSSTTRTDTGAGACEVIYVESIDILTSAHEQGNQINTYAMYAIGAIFALLFLKLSFIVLFLKPDKNIVRP